MKRYLFIFVIFIQAGCNKQASPPTESPLSEPVKFELYTDKDLSNYKDSIFFTIVIRNANNQKIWDSALKGMPLSDIPKSHQSLKIQKIVYISPNASIRAGFEYYIQHVGFSWYFKNIDSSQNEKKVVFNFQ
jgi:hypothetical protein